MASKDEGVTSKRTEEEEEEDPRAEDEDTGVQVAPIVRLQEVAVTTGEENEDVLLDFKAKLYRFDQEQWKERGVGIVKLLKHKETGKIRLVMRQNKTLKICANHLVLPTLRIQEHAGNDKSCVWRAADFADGELKDETFAIRFASVENCRFFRDLIEEITDHLGREDAVIEEANAAAREDADAAAREDADAAASLIENLSVIETQVRSIEPTAEEGITESLVQESSAGSEEANAAASLIENLSVNETQVSAKTAAEEKSHDHEVPSTSEEKHQ